MAKPIVKWAGGKTKLLPSLLKYVPKKMRTYVEPFAGGAALFFRLASEPRVSLSRAILVDKNPELVALYRAVQRDVDAVIALLHEYAGRQDRREFFYELRDAAPRADVQRAARFIFLNRTGYNGLWRVNSRGKFNVPYGRYKNPRIVDPDRLRAASAALAGVDLRHDDYAQALAGLEEQDFVYFDPPYVPVSKTASFTAYAREGFGPDDQRRLASELRRLAERGVRAMLSNADTREARALYEGLWTDTVRVPRAINSDASKRGDVGELLVFNWPANV